MMRRLNLVDLIKEGYIHPPLQITKDFKGVKFKAKIQSDGTIIYDGKRYTSLTGAANAAKKKAFGGSPSTDGWLFWKFKDPDSGELVHINSLREKLKKRQRQSKL